MPLAPDTTLVDHRLRVTSGARVAASSAPRHRGIVKQFASFTGIGVIMTLIYLALYDLFSDPLGAQAANVVAWLATAIGDTAANRRLTFGVTGRAGATRAQVQGLMVFGTGMAITSGSLLALSTWVTDPGELAQLATLAGANVVAGVLRFALLSRWVFRPRRNSAAPVLTRG